MSQTGKLQSISRVNVSDQVLAQMKNMLASGAWKPGDRIDGENELARQFGVSRVSVRSAIHQLVGMGVLTVRHGGGTYVSELVGAQLQGRLLPLLLLDGLQLREVLEFRRIIEVGCARMAARRATAEDIALLRECEQAIRQAADDVEAFARCDLNYHNALAVVAGNSLVVKTIAILQDIYSAAMVETIRIRGTQVGIFNHIAITDAIAAHDEALAERLMVEHIETIIQQL